MNCNSVLAQNLCDEVNCVEFKTSTGMALTQALRNLSSKSSSPSRMMRTLKRSTMLQSKEHNTENVSA